MDKSTHTDTYSSMIIGICFNAFGSCRPLQALRIFIGRQRALSTATRPVDRGSKGAVDRDA